MHKELTKKYIDAFDRRDLRSVSDLFCQDVVLEDPIVKRIEGKANVLAAVQGIFSGVDKLVFFAKNIFEDGDTTLIEFILILDQIELKGVDVIQWRDNKIVELRAYLDTPKG